MGSFNTVQLGKAIEKQACGFLEARGMRLIQQNYRCYQGEIDLIMQDNDDIVFVEVRYRQRIEHGSALESITPRKMKKIIKAAAHFLQRSAALHTVNSRFDVVVVSQQTGEKQLEWIKNAFLADHL